MMTFNPGVREGRGPRCLQGADFVLQMPDELVCLRGEHNVDDQEDVCRAICLFMAALLVWMKFSKLRGKEKK